jgi:adenine deaminase
MLSTLSSVRHLLLGSDSPLTAKGDLLDEVRLAHCETGIPAGALYRMLGKRAASTFHLHDGEGSIRPNATADFVAVRDRGLSPADTLASLATSDVQLVMVRGRVQLASEEILPRLPADAAAGLSPVEVDSQVRWIRAPLPHLFREAQRVLGPEIQIQLGGKRVRHVCTAWL